jgi:molybdopterin synthase catalytic subunit
VPIRVQTEDFDLSTEVGALRASQPQVGAVVTFIGTVRDMNEGEQVSEMELEHYPGRTEKALEDIVAQAKARWVDARVADDEALAKWGIPSANAGAAAQ